MTDPKILYFDIETSPLIVPVFRLGKQRVDYSQILKREQLICISWAWGDGKVYNATFDLKKYNMSKKDDDADLELVKRFSRLCEEAELVIGHNASMFDISKLKSRIVKYKLPPLSPFLVDDTYQKTKGVGFTSHKLDDVGEYLGYGNKMPHGYGMEWWIDIVWNRNPKTLAKMVKYCDRDVVQLRKVYKHVKPYINPSLNLSTYSGVNFSCLSCGSVNLEKRGFKRTLVGKFQRFQCKDCGHWASDGKNLIKAPKNYVR